MSDKLECRQWVAEKIGVQYLILLVWEKSFGDIDFLKVPSSFVLKTNHGSSTNSIVKDKDAFNLREVRMKMNRWMFSDYGLNKGLELHYGMISPRIICEQYMGENLNDYKFFYFGGKPEFVWVDVGRYTNHGRNMYDLNWNELPFIIDRFKWASMEWPRNLDMMIEFKLARKLSAGVSFVRGRFLRN